MRRVRWNDMCRAIGYDGTPLKGRNLKIGYAQRKKE